MTCWELRSSFLAMQAKSRVSIVDSQPWKPALCSRGWDLGSETSSTVQGSARSSLESFTLLFRQFASLWEQIRFFRISMSFIHGLETSLRISLTSASILTLASLIRCYSRLSESSRCSRQQLWPTLMTRSTISLSKPSAPANSLPSRGGYTTNKLINATPNVKSPPYLI